MGPGRTPGHLPTGCVMSALPAAGERLGCVRRAFPGMSQAAEFAVQSWSASSARYSWPMTHLVVGWSDTRASPGPHTRPIARWPESRLACQIRHTWSIDGRPKGSGPAEPPCASCVVRVLPTRSPAAANVTIASEQGHAMYVEARAHGPRGAVACQATRRNMAGRRSTTAADGARWTHATLERLGRSRPTTPTSARSGRTAPREDASARARRPARRDPRRGRGRGPAQPPGGRGRSRSSPRTRSSASGGRAASRSPTSSPCDPGASTRSRTPSPGPRPTRTSAPSSTSPGPRRPPDPVRRRHQRRRRRQRPPVGRTR